MIRRGLALAVMLTGVLAGPGSAENPVLGQKAEK